MRFLKVVAVIAMCFLGLSLLATASENKFGVADSRTITFNDPIRVGDTLLPSGDYQVSHVMDGNQHIMIFKQLKSSRSTEVRVQCQLVPLQKKAERTEKVYVLNAANERVLRSLTFQGDSAQHVF
jgi:hypothetical protein